ncbi:hypothetical protein ACHWQZ_G012440 [Mnemiopsis leidyi]
MIDKQRLQKRRRLEPRNRSTSEYFRKKVPVHLTLSLPYHPPKSPYSLIQETTYQDPWRLLVATVLLNKASGKVAIPVFSSLMTRYPSPESLLQDSSSLFTLSQLLLPLGLQNKRAATIIAMSQKYVKMDWEFPRELPGVGKYGDDSYRIFCCGLTNVTPCDKKLNLYTDWLQLYISSKERPKVGASPEPEHSISNSRSDIVGT